MKNISEQFTRSWHGDENYPCSSAIRIHVRPGLRGHVHTGADARGTLTIRHWINYRIKNGKH